MRILILEDELPAADRIKSQLQKLGEQYEVAGVIRSVSKGKTWLAENEEPELIISDIQLLDGIAFELFQQHPIQCPVIFTTAYDQYSLQAFEVNSLDYLLKPIQADQLEKALQKVSARSASSPAPVLSSNQLEQLADILEQRQKRYKSRFLVRLGQRIKSMPVDEIAYFFTEDKVTFLMAHNKEKFPINLSLDDLENQLDPTRFFRLNRKFMAAHEAVAAIHPHFKGRLKLELEPATDEEIVVSSDKTPSLKAWLDS